jgi:hypothetical protein
VQVAFFVWPSGDPFARSLPNLSHPVPSWKITAIVKLEKVANFPSAFPHDEHFGKLAKKLLPILLSS